jgi:hypothetical protein
MNEREVNTAKNTVFKLAYSHFEVISARSICSLTVFDIQF